jgi:hypothetical protein
MPEKALLFEVAFEVMWIGTIRLVRRGGLSAQAGKEPQRYMWRAMPGSVEGAVAFEADLTISSEVGEIDRGSLGHSTQYLGFRQVVRKRFPVGLRVSPSSWTVPKTWLLIVECGRLRPFRHSAPRASGTLLDRLA